MKRTHVDKINSIFNLPKKDIAERNPGDLPPIFRITFKIFFFSLEYNILKNEEKIY